MAYGSSSKGWSLPIFETNMECVSCILVEYDTLYICFRVYLQTVMLKHLNLNNSQPKIANISLILSTYDTHTVCSMQYIESDYPLEPYSYFTILLLFVTFCLLFNVLSTFCIARTSFFVPLWKLNTMFPPEDTSSTRNCISGIDYQ